MVSMLYVTGRSEDQAIFHFDSTEDLAEWEADTGNIKWTCAQDNVNFAQWIALVEDLRTKFGDSRVPNDIHASYCDVTANVGVQVPGQGRLWGTVHGTKP